MIKAITFDMWNTLIRDKHYGDLRVKRVFEALREMRISRSYSEIRKAYLSTHDYVYDAWTDENYRFVQVEERLRHILERLDADLTGPLRLKVLTDFQEFALADPPELVEGAFDTLSTLSSSLRMGIICDSGYTPGRILRRALAKHGVLRFFKVTVFSDENGYNKPHRSMFEKALSGLDVEPSEAVHVGDTFVTDIVGAKAAGMRAVWLNVQGTPSMGSCKPDFEIRTLPEVVSILNKMS